MIISSEEQAYKVAKIMFRRSIEAALWLTIRAMNKVFLNFLKAIDKRLKA